MVLERYLARIFAKEKISGNNLGLLFLIKMPLYIIGFRVSDEQKKYEIFKKVLYSGNYEKVEIGIFKV